MDTSSPLGRSGRDEWTFFCHPFKRKRSHADSSLVRRRRAELLLLFRAVCFFEDFNIRVILLVFGQSFNHFRRIQRFCTIMLCYVIFRNARLPAGEGNTRMETGNYIFDRINRIFRITIRKSHSNWEMCACPLGRETHEKRPE